MTTPLPICSRPPARETWPLRSAPCLSSQPDRSLRRQVVPRRLAIVRATRDGLWICGQRKGVAHISTAPAAAARFNLMIMKKSRTALSVLSQQRSGTRPANLVTMSLRHLYTDSDSHSQLVKICTLLRVQPHNIFLYRYVLEDHDRLRPPGWDESESTNG